MTDDSSAVDPFGTIVDEFMDELRQGRQPSVEEYAARFPESADRIRKVLPTLLVMEKVKAEEASDRPSGEPEPDVAMLGRELGDFRIIREVGRGGMGIVYQAEQISLGRHVALKILPHQSLLDPKQRARFELEARAAARLHHTNIVPVFGVGVEEGFNYYVMQFIHGQGLDVVLEELKRLKGEQGGRDPIVAPDHSPPAVDSDPSAGNIARSLLSGVAAPLQREREEGSPAASGRAAAANPPVSVGQATPPVWSDASLSSESSVYSLVGHSPADSSAARKRVYWCSVARIGMQVADALQYAHDQRVTHRDIKPSNLLLDLRGTTWVTDFGLAKADDQQDITHTGDILGTLRYMPPEAFAGESDARSDIYSLGLTLYELITLQAAFQDSDRRRLVKRITDGEPLDISRVQRGVPRDLATIVLKAIEREPRHRYQTARELCEDLRRFINDEPVRARRANWLERFTRWSRRNKALTSALASIAGLLLLITIGSIIAAAYFRRQQEIQRELFQKAEQQEQVTAQNLYYAHMVLAHQAFDQHRGIVRTRALLDRWRPGPGERDLRGWEWYYINALCHRDLFSLSGHTDDVTGVAWSPDGSRVASAGADGTVRIWNVASRSLLETFEDPFDKAYSVAWDSQGTRLAAGGDKGVVVWDLADGKILHQSSEDRDVYSVAWSSGDESLAIAIKEEPGMEGEVQILDTRSWAVPPRIHQTRIGTYNTTISWDPKGQWLAFPSRGNVAIWDLESGETQYLAGHTDSVQAVAFHPASPGILASSSRDAIIRIWDLNSATTIAEFKGHTHGIASIAWSPDGMRLASAAWDGTARVWNWSGSGRTQLAQFNGHSRHCFAVAWDPTGTMLATVGDDHLIKFWDPHRLQKVHDIPALSRDVVKGLFFTRDGRQFCAISQRGELSLWNAAGGELVRKIDNEGVPQLAASFHPNGKRLASLGNDNQVRFWDVGTGRPLRILKQNPTRKIKQPDFKSWVWLSVSHRRMSWSADGSRLAVADGNGEIVIWNVATGDVARRLRDAAHDVIAIDLSPDGSRVASAGLNGLIRVWNTATGNSTTLTGHVGRVLDVDWNSDGTRLASAGDDHTVRIWTTSGVGSVVLKGHNEVVRTVAWGPDDRRVLSGDARGTLILWDSESGQETLQLRGRIGTLLTACWSPDGHRIAAGSNGHVLIWDATKGFDAEVQRPQASNE